MNVHKCVQSEKCDSLSAVYECVSSSFISQGLILNQTDFDFFFKFIV